MDAAHAGVLAGSAQSGFARGLLAWAEAAGAECLEVSEAVLAKLAAKDNPQTMLGVFEQRWASEPAPSRSRRTSLWVALEAIRDPGNLGTIIRTADAVGASGVALIGASCDPYSREAVRASMGSIFNVPLLRIDQDRFLAWAAAWTGDMVGTHLSGREDFAPCPYARQPAGDGREGPGLSPALAAGCSRLVKIPMAGRLDSLNLAVATALMLYEIRKGQPAIVTRRRATHRLGRASAMTQHNSRTSAGVGSASGLRRGRPTHAAYAF